MNAKSVGSAHLATICVDEVAIAANVRTLRSAVGSGVAMMSVVKADGYGHGMGSAARAARAGGAEWLGVATLDEALELRRTGDTGRALCWLAEPGADFGSVIAAGVDVTASSTSQLREIADACSGGVVGRVQLKVNTGLSRNGAPEAQWAEFFALAKSLQDQGSIIVTGLWSHFACADEPDHPANEQQELVFRTAISHADAIGLEPEFKHIANSAATLWRPSARFDLVRCGISIYGLSPNPQIASSRDLGLTPAMTVKATVVNAMDLPKGAGVSYGHTFVTEHPTRVALVPMGYAEGIPRHASNQAQVWLNGQRADLLGLVCMDQIVAAAPRAQIGDDVIVFGPGDHGEPTADEWAAWCQTINYEIVTRIGGRAKRVVMTPRVQEGS